MIFASKLAQVDEDVIEKILRYLSLKEIVAIERVNVTIGDVSRKTWSSISVILRSESLYGHQYVTTSLRCPNLQSFDASRALMDSDLMKHDDAHSIGVKLAEACPNIKFFKGLGVLGTILVANYMEIVSGPHNVVEIELLPGTNSERYTVSELKNPFVGALRIIVAKGINIKKTSIVASYDWAALLCKTPYTEGDESGQSVLEVLGSRTKSVKTNYDMIYRQMNCSGVHLQELNIEFNLSETFITSLSQNHPNLVCLKINCPKSIEAFESLHSLHLLKHLELRQITMGSITDYFSVFREFLSARGSRLTELCLVNVYVDFSHIWVLIGMKCVNLKRFKVNRYWFDQKNQDEIFDTIILLLKLRRLELLDFFHRKGFTKDQINQMIHLKPKLTFIKYCPKTMSSDARKKAIKLIENEVNSYQTVREFRGRRPITLITDEF